MKDKRQSTWRWCPEPERTKLTRTRPADRPWLPLVASALILSLLAIQGAQMWAPSAVNANYMNSFSTVPAVEPSPDTTPSSTTASETNAVISSDHLTIQFTFPESADPGKTITVSAITTAKADKKVSSLSIEIFAYVDKQLTKTASATVLKDQRVHSGDTWQTTLAVIVPVNAQRSAMIGTVTETWDETTTYYYSPQYYWPYYPYYDYSYPYSYPPYPPYPYNYTIYYVYEPSYVLTEKSSQQTVPLTYVLATTPEYDDLLARHTELQQDYDALVARYNDLSAKYDQVVSEYKQLESNYNAATLELKNYRTYTYVLIVVSVALGAALVFVLSQGRKETQPLKKHE